MADQTPAGGAQDSESSRAGTTMDAVKQFIAGGGRARSIRKGTDVVGLGASYAARCRACGNEFRADIGGGRRFQQLRCEVCGQEKAVMHAAVPEAFERYVAAAEDDSLTEDDQDLAVAEFREAVEAVAGACACGGRCTYRAPLRCPGCRSRDVDLGKMRMTYS